MNPPSVWLLMMPMSHRTSSTVNRVQSISIPGRLRLYNGVPEIVSELLRIEGCCWIQRGSELA